ncbi:MAG: modification methylase, partial [Abditibacteriota bacterium]|nr:modification methylase [Abditibacteriota bacterium]
MKHTIYWGDARAMSDVTDDSVHLVVTSPPYWQLKDYGVDGQIGFHDSLEEYGTKLNQVWAECFRVLHAGCRLCINIGDQFARAAHYGRYKVIPLHSQIIAACELLGFDYMGAIIWQKTTTMNASGGGAVMGSFPRPRNGIVKLDYEFILLFKKLGTAPKPTPEQKQQSTLTHEEWNQFFSGHWNFPGEKQGDGHLAMFPLELPRRLIRMFSFSGETVLDPFAGSGTTLRAARELGRSGIGYEINRDFEQTVRKRWEYRKAVKFKSSKARVEPLQSTSPKPRASV